MKPRYRLLAASSGNAQLGVSLIELMVAMAIGLVVVGAVFTNYLHNAAGSRQTSALTQVTSDAAIALGIMRNYVAIAGYGRPTGIDDTTGLQTMFTGANAALVGCDHGFTSGSASAAVADVRCNEEPADGATSAGNSLLVRHETDTDISPAVTSNSQAGTYPSDCVGNAITATTAVAESRFRVSKGSTGDLLSLRCAGVDHSYEALVDNVIQLHVRYGLGEPDGETGKLKRVRRYVKASEVAVPGATNWQAEWNKVLAVRICMVVRSTEPVLTESSQYLDCEQNPIDVTDRHIYRAFTTTVLVNNRQSGTVLNAEEEEPV